MININLRICYTAPPIFSSLVLSVFVNTYVPPALYKLLKDPMQVPGYQPIHPCAMYISMSPSAWNTDFFLRFAFQGQTIRYKVLSFFSPKMVLELYAGVHPSHTHNTVHSLTVNLEATSVTL